MAALALPLLESAVNALLVALGVTTVAGTAVVVSEEVKKRQREAADAKAVPVAKTAPKAETKSCKKCPPDCGALVERNWHMSDNSRAYQARITGFAPGTEWQFSGLDFDGFKSAECLLVEAKAEYDQFLEQQPDGSIAPKAWYASFETKMLPQARTQAIAALQGAPARLHWYFQTPLAYQYMAPALRRTIPLQPIYQP